MIADNTLFKVYPIKQVLFTLLTNGKKFRSSIIASKEKESIEEIKLPIPLYTSMAGDRGCQTTLSFFSIYSGSSTLYIISFNPHNNSVGQTLTPGSQAKKLSFRGIRWFAETIKQRGQNYYMNLSKYNSTAHYVYHDTLPLLSAVSSERIKISCSRTLFFDHCQNNNKLFYNNHH